VRIIKFSFGSFPAAIGNQLMVNGLGIIRDTPVGIGGHVFRQRAIANLEDETRTSSDGLKHEWPFGRY
jgi:hypothetical protein